MGYSKSLIRICLVGAVALAFAVGRRADAQPADQSGVAEQPGQRLSSIVGVAVGEYGKGVDERGQLISAEEFAEATGFLRDGREVADRLPGALAATVRPVLDTLIAAADAKRPPHEIQVIYQRFVAALGSVGALELPQGPIDVAAGSALYSRNCASCHGAGGQGDGPAARGLSTAPPAIGSEAVTRSVSPALAYRLVSVGVRGTAMPAWSTTLSATERWNVIAYVMSLHSTRAQVRTGEGLFIQRCAACHGASGGGGGTYAHDLSTTPPPIGTLGWQAERSDSQLAGVIRDGVPGSAMPANRDLAPAEIASVIAFIRTLPGAGGGGGGEGRMLQVKSAPRLVPRDRPQRVAIAGQRPRLRNAWRRC